MSRVIDISAKLTNENPKIKLADDKIYEVDSRKNTIIKMKQKIQSMDADDIAAIDEMIELLLGKEAAKAINSMNPPLADYQNIMLALVAAVTDEDFEKTKARFRRDTDS